jgi:hypothetical protein
VLPALAHPDPQLIFGAGRCVLQLAAHPVLGGVQPGGGDSWSERPVWAATTLSSLLGLLRFHGDAPASHELLCRPLVTCMGWVKHADFVVAVSNMSSPCLLLSVALSLPRHTCRHRASFDPSCV